MNNSQQNLLKQLPKVDSVLSQLSDENYQLPREYVLDVIRREIENARVAILNDEWKQEDHPDIDEEVVKQVKQRCAARQRTTMPKVINATGIVLHTGLGRAPLSDRAQNALNHAADGYSSLEFDLESGKRGQRNDHIEDLLCSLTGAEAGLMVNNNAAAVLLAINTLADKKETVISRGQLVEIGGSFRIPEVMAKSGATMVEIGTTNRTHLKDYQNAISEDTGIILIAHTSNYRVEGFTAMPSLEEIVELAHQHKIPTLYDLGSGAFYDPEQFGLPHEPVVREVIEAGVDVVTFSGDKLVGGPQAGLLVGKDEYLSRIKRNPLTRALRCDKLIHAAMEATLQTYITPEQLPDENTTYKLLTRSLGKLEKVGKKILGEISLESHEVLNIQLVKAGTQAGSGSMPTEEISGMALVCAPESWTPDRFMRRMRTREVPVIGYIESDRCLFNLRTVFDDDIPEMVRAFSEIAGEISSE